MKTAKISRFGQFYTLGDRTPYLAAKQRGMAFLNMQQRAKLTFRSLLH